MSRRRASYQRSAAVIEHQMPILTPHLSCGYAGTSKRQAALELAACKTLASESAKTFEEKYFGRTLISSLPACGWARELVAGLVGALSFELRVTSLSALQIVHIASPATQRCVPSLL